MATELDIDDPYFMLGSSKFGMSKYKQNCRLKGNFQLLSNIGAANCRITLKKLQDSKSTMYLDD